MSLKIFIIQGLRNSIKNLKSQCNVVGLLQKM